MRKINADKINKKRKNQLKFLILIFEQSFFLSIHFSGNYKPKWFTLFYKVLFIKWFNSGLHLTHFSGLENIPIYFFILIYFKSCSYSFARSSINSRFEYPRLFEKDSVFSIYMITLTFFQNLWEKQWGEISPYNLVTVEKYLDDMHHVLNDKHQMKRAHSFLPYLFKVNVCLSYVFIYVYQNIKLWVH